MSSTKGLECSGCLNIISGEYLTCKNCHLLYDLLCGNVNRPEYRQMKADPKRSWVCDDCRNKKPKSNKNYTQSLVQPENLFQCPETDDAHLNITLRNKSNPRKTDFGPANITSGEERSALREELKLILPTLLATELAPQQQLQDLQESVQFVSNQYEDLSKS